MNIVMFLLIGLLAGWIASSLVEGYGLGILGDILVGVAGAFIGGYAFDLLGYTAGGFWGSLGMAVVGAVLLLWIVGAIAGPHRTRGTLKKL